MIDFEKFGYVPKQEEEEKDLIELSEEQEEAVEEPASEEPKAISFIR